MKQYRVTLLYATDADSLYQLCVMEAARLVENAQFKPDEPNRLEYITNLLVRECKAYMLGFVKLEELVVELPVFLQSPNYKLETWPSTQQVWTCKTNRPTILCPAFKWQGKQTSAHEITELLSYELDAERCTIYDDILKSREAYL